MFPEEDYKNHSNNFIVVEGAKEHNLKNLHVKVPKNQLVVFTGVSGSGKSSLAFDTIYNEGQRRYMESFGAYARQFMGDMERPDVDNITGLSPVIAIEQKSTNKNPRSTVGTVTEIYDFLRLWFAKASVAYSFQTGKRMEKHNAKDIVAAIYQQFAKEKIEILAPLVKGRKGHYRELFEEWLSKGYLKMRIDGELKEIKSKMQLDRYKVHDIDLVIDRLPVQESMQGRLLESVETALKIGKGLLRIVQSKDKENSDLGISNNIFSVNEALYSNQLMEAETGISYEEPSPNSFSFNSPYGACPRCTGLGSIFSVDMETLIPNGDLSIQEGGIIPVGEKRDAWIFNQVSVIAKQHKIRLDIPISNMPKEHLNLVLYGNEKGNTSLKKGDDFAAKSDEAKGFEGVIPMINRWFSSTSSDGIRAWAEAYMHEEICPGCNGWRLKTESLHFKIDNKNIAEISNLEIEDLFKWTSNVNAILSPKQAAISKDVLKEINDRLLFLLDVGLEYLTLLRPTKTLSGGESQRIRLATQIGSKLKGITYIMDEPSIGLHQRDNQRLIKALEALRDMGNTVLVVEHDKDIMLASDYIFDIGPMAGRHGGNIVAEGTPNQMLLADSETAKYLSGRLKIELPTTRRDGNGNWLRLLGASGNTLKSVDAFFPLGTFIVVSGVSGSGKSTLINETLYPLLSNHAFRQSKKTSLPFKEIQGLQHIDKVIEIDQNPIGRTPRSNPATYCGFFTEIRQLFALVPEAKIRGYKPGRFSFNVKGGRCETCEGGGLRVIEMNFLPDVYVPCHTCHGKRYNRETLEIRYKSKSIADVLNMTIDDAVEFFKAVPWLHRKIKTLQAVGLGYITLGQNAVTLSGGEAQRVKLSTELGKKDTGKTFYILDEPTTGLHFQDINILINVLQNLVNNGNTVLIIEHNIDVIKMADYILDLGPEAGKNGGEIIYQGKPEGILNLNNSHTGTYLKMELDAINN